MPSVSHSEVESYLRCKRAWYYSYIEGIEPIGTASNLVLGTAVHKLLETYYNVILAAGDVWKDQVRAMPKALRAAQEAYDQMIREGYEDSSEKRNTLHDLMFNFYFPNEPFMKAGWRILAVEKEFKLEYDSELQLHFPFVVDLIALDPDGKTVVIDHKTTWDFYNEEDTDFMTQIPKYIGALRALNYRIDYGYYNEIRTRKIKGTKNKDGSYPGPQVDQVLNHLELKPNGVRVANTFKDQMTISRELQRLKSLPKEEVFEICYVTTAKMISRSCSFKSLELAELNGRNIKLLLRSEYKPRERRVFNEVSEEAE